jgi:hypothetical protein
MMAKNSNLKLINKKFGNFKNKNGNEIKEKKLTRKKSDFD